MKFTKNLAVARQLLTDKKVYPTVKPVRDTRQVNSGALVVDLAEGDIYMCVCLYLNGEDHDHGMWWTLIDLDTGDGYGARYYGEPDNGLPLDRFIEKVDPDRYVVIYDGRVSTQLAGCNTEVRL